MNIYSSRILYVILLLVVFSFTPGCVVDVDLDGDAEVYVDDPFSYTETADGLSVLNLKSINGVVEVFGDPEATDIRIDGTRRVGGETRRDAEDHLEKLDVDITRDGSRLWIETDQPRVTFGREYIVDYTITLPPDMEVFLEHVNGEVYVESLDEYLSVEHTNGAIELRDLRCDLIVDLVNGSVMSDLELLPDGVVEIETTNGDIDLEIPVATSADLDAQVTNGRIYVSNFDIDPGNARDLSATLGDGDGAIDLRTVNGSIHVTGVE